MYLEVFSRRWGHNDRYRIEKTGKGWNVDHISIGGDCNKRGEPKLFENLEHDSINYPADLGGYLEYLWDVAEDQNLDEASIQRHLDSLGAWIQATEKAAPAGIWDEYK